jgi:hypothetical protein
MHEEIVICPQKNEKRKGTAASRLLVVKTTVPFFIVYQKTKAY